MNIRNHFFAGSMVFGLLLVGVGLTQAEQTANVTISGVIRFVKTGALHLSLVNKAQFECDDDESSKEKANPSCDQEVARLVITPTAQEIEQKETTFTLNNIPQGTYVIQIYQDINANNTFDEGAFGPKEPWGMSNLAKKPKFSAPKWDDVKFDVNADMTDITIVVH